MGWGEISQSLGSQQESRHTQPGDSHHHRNPQPRCLDLRVLSLEVTAACGVVGGVLSEEDN